MMGETQPMKVKTTTGATVEISLEEWIKSIIDASLEKHKVTCPLNQHVIDATALRTKENLHDRVNRLELKMCIVQWVGGSIGIASIAHIINTVAGLLGR